jgi:GTPase SAR1 family protein
MFAQVVVGPPGSGKTTYCQGMAQYMESLGRKVAIVNLDPANDTLPYKPKVDLSDLIQLDEVMETIGLGPNGGLVYCLEYLETNIDWLKEKLAAPELAGHYFIFDLPGQGRILTRRCQHHTHTHSLVVFILCCVLKSSS